MKTFMKTLMLQLIEKLFRLNKSALMRVETLTITYRIHRKNAPSVLRTIELEQDKPGYFYEDPNYLLIACFAINACEDEDRETYPDFLFSRLERMVTPVGVIQAVPKVILH